MSHLHLGGSLRSDPRRYVWEAWAFHACSCFPASCKRHTACSSSLHVHRDAFQDPPHHHTPPPTYPYPCYHPIPCLPHPLPPTTTPLHTALPPTHHAHTHLPKQTPPPTHHHYLLPACLPVVFFPQYAHPACPHTHHTTFPCLDSEWTFPLRSGRRHGSGVEHEPLPATEMRQAWHCVCVWTWQQTGKGRQMEDSAETRLGCDLDWFGMLPLGHSGVCLDMSLFEW